MERSRSLWNLGRPVPTVAVAVLVVGLYLLPAAGHPPAVNPNELVRLELAVGLAAWSSADLERPAHLYGLSEDVARRGDRLLADKAPGLSFAAVPVVWLACLVAPSVPGTALPEYWPLRHLATGLLVSVVTGLLCFFMAASIPAIAAADRVPVAIVGALATPLWTYGAVFFGHAPAAYLIATAWMLLLRPLADPDGSNVARTVLGGVAAGFAVTTEYPTAILVVIVYSTLVARRRPWRELAAALVGLAVGLLPALLYHQTVFGAPWLTGYAFKADSGFAAIHATGVAGISLPTIESLWGVVFGPARGLLFFSPILLLAPVGVWLVHRRYGARDSVPIVVAAVAYITFAAGFVDWTAGWCAAARHLVPLVPLLVIPTMTVIKELARRPWARLVVAFLLGLSVTRGLLTLAVTPFFPPEFDHPLLQLVVPSISDGALAPNILTSVTGIPEAVAWSAAAVLALAVATWALARLSRPSAAAVAAAVILAAAGQLGWYALNSTSTDPTRERLRAQVLAGLGHREVAVRILSESRAQPED